MRKISKVRKGREGRTEGRKGKWKRRRGGGEGRKEVSNRKHSSDLDIRKLGFQILSHKFLIQCF